MPYQLHLLQNYYYYLGSFFKISPIKPQNTAVIAEVKCEGPSFGLSRSFSFAISPNKITHYQLKETHDEHQQEQQR
jgi:hypothetical protein